MGSDRVRQRHTVAIGELPQLVLVRHRPRGCARPEERAAEACTLLVRPRDEPNRDRRLALLRDPAQHLRAGDDVERTVEPAAVRNRVEVAADEQLPLRSPAKRPPLVARLVELHLRAGSLELGRHPLLRLDPGVGPGHALGAVLVARQLSELLQLRNRACGIERHDTQNPLPSGSFITVQNSS